MFPSGSGGGLASGGVFKRTVKGMAVGPVMNLCSACIVPVSTAFGRKGVGIEGTIAMVQSSATMNIPALAMVFFVFTPMLGFSRLFLAIIGALLLGPIVALAIRRGRGDAGMEVEPVVIRDEPETGPWVPVLMEACRDWVKASLGYLVRLGPLMIVAAFVSGLVIQWLNPETVSTYLGNNITGIAIAATFGILINVPLLFEIPLVALLLLFGMGTAPAATLLFTAAAGGPFTFWGLAKAMPKRAIAIFAAATWVLGALGGLAVLGIGVFIWESGDNLRVEAANRTPVVMGEPFSSPITAVTPFTRLDPRATKRSFIHLGPPAGGRDILTMTGMGTWTSMSPPTKVTPTCCIKTDGGGNFEDVAEEAGVEAVEWNSTGVVACDFNNDGYQDLYVGSKGALGDGLGFRSPPQTQGNRDVLYLNNRDGTFTDITGAAFGDAANLRSATSIACADVDGDRWLDLYVGNLFDDDFSKHESADSSRPLQRAVSQQR